jgi:AAA ATPase domain
MDGAALEPAEEVGDAPGHARQERRGGGHDEKLLMQNPVVTSRVLSPVFVGRQEELSQLEDALLAANRGEGSFVLLGGEAGIGKTRLARELARRAYKLGGETLWGSCSEAELALPYLPFVEAMGSGSTNRTLARCARNSGRWWRSWLGSAG